MIPASIFPFLSAEQKGQMFNNNGLEFQRRAALGVPSRIATMQRPPVSIVQDQMEETRATEAAMAPLFDSTLNDRDLVKSQLGRGAGAIMGSPSTQLGPNGQIDYSNIQPIRGGATELLNNPKFINLARTDRANAERVYSAITGRSMGEDFQQRQKLATLRQKEAADTFRSMAMRGEARLNPETNFIERKVTIPDKTDVTGQRKVDAWETMDLEGQAIYSGAYEDATGMKMPGANPIMSLPYDNATKGRILAHYIRNVRDNKMDVQAALRLAIKEVPPPTSARAAMTGHPTTPSPEDNAAMEQAGIASLQTSPTPPPASAGPEAYQQWAQAQAQAGAAQGWNNFAAAGQKMNEGAMYGLNSIARLGQNIVRGVDNLGAYAGNSVNSLATRVGAPAPLPWQRPMNEAEYMAEAQRQQSPEAQRARASAEMVQMLQRQVNPGPLDKFTNWLYNLRYPWE